MKVDFNSWHARLFRFHHKMKYGWEPSSNYGYNLCPYMRTVLFHWWLRWIFIDGRIGNLPVSIPIAVIAFFFGPGWLGMISYGLKCFMYVVDAVALLILIVLGVIGLFILIKEKVQNSKFHDAVLEPIADATCGFAHLSVGYARSFHDSICPHIDFVDNTRNKSTPEETQPLPDEKPEEGETAADVGCA